MSDSDREGIRGWSISRKVTIAVTAVVGIGIGLMLTVQVFGVRDTLYHEKQQSRSAIAELLAVNMSGGVRWRKQAAVEKVYSSFVAREGAMVSNLVVLDVDGGVLARYAAEALPAAALDPLPAPLAEALAADELASVVTEGHVLVGAPVLNGKDSSRVGTLLMAFSLAQADEEVGRLARTVAVIGGALVIAVIVLLVVVLRHIVVVPLREATAHMRDIAHGDCDLTRRLVVDGNNELGDLARWVNVFVERIQGTVGQMVSVADRVSGASAEMVEVAGESSRNLTEQRREIEQVTSAATQVSNTVGDVAGSASQAAASTADAEQEASNGQRVVSATVEVITALSGEMEHACTVVNRLGSDSESIGAVLDVIRGIAEQTNLLALNAAIEAARAGDQGRGFAVVADEVRTLASRTQQSTEEIQAMIERLQGAAREAVSVMERGRESTRDGVQRAAEAGESLDAIHKAVNSIKDMNSHIALATEEQRGVAEAMHEAIGHISERSKRGVETGARSEDSARGMAGAAGELAALAGQFTV